EKHNPESDYNSSANRVVLLLLAAEWRSASQMGQLCASFRKLSLNFLRLRQRLRTADFRRLVSRFGCAKTNSIIKPKHGFRYRLTVDACAVCRIEIFQAIRVAFQQQLRLMRRE